MIASQADAVVEYLRKNRERYLEELKRWIANPSISAIPRITIGPVSSFDRVLHLPHVLIGVGLPDDAIHAPNEKFDLHQFYGGIETMTHLYSELARALA